MSTSYLRVPTTIGVHRACTDTSISLRHHPLLTKPSDVTSARLHDVMKRSDRLQSASCDEPEDDAKTCKTRLVVQTSSSVVDYDKRFDQLLNPLPDSARAVTSPTHDVENNNKSDTNIRVTQAHRVKLSKRISSPTAATSPLHVLTSELSVDVASEKRADDAATMEASNPSGGDVGFSVCLSS